MRGVADRAVPLGQALHRHAQAAAQRQWQDADRARRAREQSERQWTWLPLGKLVAITGASGSGKSTLINEILYKALWKRLVDTRTLPGRARRRGRRGACAQGGQHRPIADRAQQPVEPGDLHRLLRHHPRPVHAGAAGGGARVQSRAASASTSKAAAARSARAKASSPRSYTSCRTWK